MAEPGRVSRIALVNVPFGMADRPSIQCAILKSCVKRAGHEADVFYLNLELAAELGADLYQHLSIMSTDQLLGEWLFSSCAFDELREDAAYLSTYFPNDEIIKDWGVDSQQLVRLRNQLIPAWVDRWINTIDWGRYDIVGFTTTFEQNNAAFSLARRIKERHPEVLIIFGGANFDGTMGREYIRALPFIDYAVVGEADDLLPEIMTRVAEGESLLGMRGVVGRADGQLVENGLPPRIEDMDSLPDPDYTEYFETLFRLGPQTVLGNAAPGLLFETSRGCWWGEKQHCTFCGLNALGMQFRAKSPSAALGQLERLSTKYNINKFEAVDNIIDHRYIEKLCGPLAEHHFDYRIFYEVKANISPRQLKAMARAGITRIQPGIESLNTHILALMRKGTTMVRNVRLLKWAHYYGMQVGWNILLGFPGETEEDYVEQNRVISLLRHLPPPAGHGRIRLERFSPYFFDPSFPVSNVRPLAAYGFIYPQQKINLAEIAYYFDYDMDSTLPYAHHRKLRDLIREWKEAWRHQPRPTLLYQRAPGWLQIVDRRTQNVAVYMLSDWEADVYEMCGETEHSAAWLAKALAERSGRDGIGVTEVEAALGKLRDLGLMLEEQNSFLSLALPANRYL
jgi:ribosomal peptide maturation radical SAM protein 1